MDLITIRDLALEFGVGVSWLRKDFQEVGLLTFGEPKYANTTLAQANLYRKYHSWRAVQEASRARKAHYRREIGKSQLQLELWP